MATTLEQVTQEFVNRWSGRGDEKQETQTFWLDLLGNVLGRKNALAETKFEYRTVGNGFIDVLCPDARLLVEQKSSSVDLDKSEIRQGTPVTPVQQALRYAQALPFSLKPSVLCTCNFNRFRFYDLETDPLASGAPVDEFTLDQLPEHVDMLRRIFSRDHSRVVVQQKLSEHAGVLVANLHNALAAQYVNPDDPVSHHSLALLTVRLVFALYAEDAGLFPSDGFSDYVKSYDAGHLRRAIIDLFRVLDTTESERDPYLEDELKHFPYVNGGLFRGSIEIPPFTDEIRDALIHAGEHFSWKNISPVIFGSLMEETLSHDQRRKGGMHYTTVKNIHRLIDPLFLDDLKNELNGILDDSTIGEQARLNRLTKYQDKLAGLKFLDPACGSGNFLTETFLQLRELENKVIAARLHGQGYVDFGQDSDAGSLVKVRIDQFHGIEINDFAVSVAKTALWIAEQQALDDTEDIAGQTLNHLPLHDSGNIVQANALQYDWNELLPGAECSYVMGNPPFIGHISRTGQTAEDMKLVWGKDYDGYLDYATGWHRKASQYLTRSDSAFAFVSTNSVVQGQPVASLFKPLFADGWHIAFAHRTFAWDAQSTDVAHVHVVIIGMRKDTGERLAPPPKAI
nr:class I SAM-dependent DNA methyltransferase [Bifidobacterium scaligerum]